MTWTNNNNLRLTLYLHERTNAYWAHVWPNGRFSVSFKERRLELVYNLRILCALYNVFPAGAFWHCKPGISVQDTKAFETDCHILCGQPNCRKLSRCPFRRPLDRLRWVYLRDCLHHNAQLLVPFRWIVPSNVDCGEYHEDSKPQGEIVGVHQAGKLVKQVGKELAHSGHLLLHYVGTDSRGIGLVRDFRSLLRRRLVPWVLLVPLNLHGSGRARHTQHHRSDYPGW